MIDIAKSAVCSFLTCNDRYDWSVYIVCFSPPIYMLHYYQWQCPISSEHWVIKRCHIVIDGVDYTCIRENFSRIFEVVSRSFNAY